MVRKTEKERKLPQVRVGEAPPYTDFYEKALFVKPTWRPLCGGRICCVPFARYASIRTLLVSLLFLWLGAYDEIRLGSGSTKVLQSSERSLFLSDRPSPYAQSPYVRSEARSGGPWPQPLYRRVAALCSCGIFTSSLFVASLPHRLSL